MKYDIPINITAVANNESLAEKQVMEFMIAAIREFGIEHRIADFNYFEFVTEEPRSSGCGDNNHTEGQCACAYKQTGNDSTKASCC